MKFFRCQSRDSPGAYDEDHGDAGCPPTAPGGPYAGTDICPSAHGGPHAGAGRYALKEVAAYGELMQEQAPGRVCRPWKAHVRPGLLAGTVACRGPTLEQSIPKGMYPIEGIHAGEVLEDL